MSQQASTPLLVPVDDYRNVTELLTRRVAAAPTHIAFEVPARSGLIADPWRGITTEEFHDRVSRLAKGFIAAGLQPGDAIAIMSATRYDWAVADLAAWFAGAVVVPIYDTASLTQVSAILRDAEVRAAIGGNDEQLRTLDRAFLAAGTTPLGVWAIPESPTLESGDEIRTPRDQLSLEDLMARSHEVTDEELERRRVAAGPDTPATIVYTSGTTGEPKGAVLTHRNFLGQVLNIAAAYGEVVRPSGNTVIFLPLAHVLARGLQLICLATGMRIAHLANPADVVASLPVLRPTFLVVVPRVLEKVQAAAADRARNMRLAPVWRSAAATAVAWGAHAEEQDAGVATSASMGLRIRRAAWDRLFYARLRSVLGGRVEYILSGGASLDAQLSLFFRGMGIPVVEGYGLTETTAPLTGNLPGSIRSGTVGMPLPGLTVRISEQGEILARGIGVCGGYRNPAHNEHAFVDGFFRTGDLGSLDRDGRLTLLGRLKDVIVTSGGKTVVPTAWENAVAAHPLVAHAVMVGDGRPYLSALLLLDPDELKAWSLRSGHSVSRSTESGCEEVNDSHLRAELDTTIAAANELVARSERVRRFTLVCVDLSDTTLITPTMKVKRGAVLERGSLALDKLYS